MRTAVSVALGVLTLTSLCMAEDVRASMRHYALNIPEQTLDAALRDLAQQTGMQIGRFSDTSDGDVMVGPLTGQLSVEQALKSLLGSCALTYRMVNERTIAVVNPNDPRIGAADDAVGAAPLADDGHSNGEAGWPPQIAQNPSALRTSEESRVADTQERPSTTESKGDTSKKGGPPAEVLQEVLVTARKRSERLLDVPMPVSVINADDLMKTNKTSLRDFAAQVPGLSVQTDGSTITTMSIRGLSLGAATNPTVGITIDDVAPGSSTFLGGGAFVPEFDPAEIESIEVLRGPQGSLYGAASPSGLIRYVTADPSTRALSGHLRAGAGVIKGGDSVGRNVSGSINVPLNDTLAVRASAFTRTEPGYVDNPVRGTRGINYARVFGGTLAALWAPSDIFSLKLSATYQNDKKDGTEDSQPSLGFGDFKQDRLAGTGMSSSRYMAYTARAHLELGSATLTSVTGYHVRDVHTSIDSTLGFFFLTESTEDVFGVPNDTTGIALTSDNRISKFTQELRLAVPFGHKIDWLLGVFFGRETNGWRTGVPGLSIDTGAVAADWGYYDSNLPYTDKAVFTDLTVHLTDRFDVQLGGRDSRTEQSYSEIDTGPFVPLLVGVPSPYEAPSTHDTETAFTYSVTPRLKVSPNLMTYARVASGYSPGGSNSNAELTGVPKSYKPNTTINYELGVKGKALDNRLMFDVSVYYINWKDIPVSLAIESENGQRNTYTGNAGSAITQGAEVFVQVRPARGLTVGGWVAFNDAHLTEGFPETNHYYGARGDALPFSVRRSASLTADQEFPLGAARSASVGVTLSYVGRHLGDFMPRPPDIPPRQVFPGYATFDLRASLNLASWSVDLYANNVTDKRALMYGGEIGSLTSDPGVCTFIAPRQVGMSFSKTF